LRVQSQQLPTESQVLEDEVLPGTENADQPTEEMSKRHDHGKNCSGKIRIQLCAKSFIQQVYDVLARHSSGDMFRTALSDRRLLQALPNIDANLLNRIVPIAEPIPLWRVRLCSACHVRRPGRNHYGIGPLKASDELPPLPAVSLPFAH